MNNCLKIIEKICKNNNIKIKKVSKDWVLILNKNDITSYIVGYKFNLNSQATAEICDDEYKIIEINSGLMMENLIDLLPDGKEITYSIYEEAILKMML